MVMEETKGAWGGVTVVRKCDSHEGGVKGIKNVCWCDGHGGDVRVCGKV